MFRITLLITTLFCYQQLFSQGMGGRGEGGGLTPNGRVSGQVIDSYTNAPIEYASIAIYRLRDSSLVTGTITGSDGRFEMQDLPYGPQFIEAKFMGYSAYTSESFRITPQEPTHRISTISLKPAAEDLEAVVVTGQRQMISQNLDKRVFNVEQDINLEGGTALDIMQNIPAVQVDIEGNVSLRGSTNVTILVDGRPSNLTSLDEVPASMIESVEIITNPSARFDPDGLSGIINIVLKRQRTPGYHGMVSVNAGTGDKYSGSLNFNYRQGNVNLFTNINLRQHRMTGSTFSERTSELQDFSSLLIQDQNFRRRGQFGSVRAGADYFINSGSTISLSGNLFSRSFSSWDQTHISSFMPLSVLHDSYSRSNEGDNDFDILELALNYRLNGNSNGGREFYADVFYSQFSADFGSQMNQWWNPDNTEFIPIPLLEQQSTLSNSHAVTFQSDIVQPVGNGGRFEAGIKGVIRASESNYSFLRFESDQELWADDPFRSNLFAYDEQTYSAYTIYSIKPNRISYQVGVRAEQAFTRGSQLATDSIVDRTFFNLFPSAHIKYDFNDVHSMQLAYSKRVNRPHIRLLNPFIDYSDPLNISMGNPWLEPEYTNSYELSHLMRRSQTQASGSIFVRNTQNVISRFVALRDDGVAESTYRNLHSSLSYGLEGIVTQTLTSWWRVNVNASYFKTEVNGEGIPPEAREGYSWTTRGTSTWTIARDLEIQLNGTYRSPQVTVGGTGFRYWQSGAGQGRTDEMYWFDLGLRLRVLDRKGTITLRVSDILATQRFSSHTFGSNFSSSMTRTRESQVIYLGFSYRINEYRQRRDRTADQDLGMDMD